MQAVIHAVGSNAFNAGAAWLWASGDVAALNQGLGIVFATAELRQQFQHHENEFVSEVLTLPLDHPVHGNELLRRRTFRMEMDVNVQGGMRTWLRQTHRDNWYEENNQHEHVENGFNFHVARLTALYRLLIGGRIGPLTVDGVDVMDANGV